MAKKIAVLDYVRGKVWIDEVPKDIEQMDAQDIAVCMGYDLSGIEYMVADTLEVEINTSASKVNMTFPKSTRIFKPINTIE